MKQFAAIVMALGVMACGPAPECDSGATLPGAHEQLRVVWAFLPEHCLSCGEPSWLIRELNRRYGSRTSFQIVTTADDSTMVRSFLQRSRIATPPTYVSRAALRSCFAVSIQPTMSLMAGTQVVRRNPYSGKSDELDQILQSLVQAIDSIGVPQASTSLSGR